LSFSILLGDLARDREDIASLLDDDSDSGWLFCKCWCLIRCCPFKDFIFGSSSPWRFKELIFGELVMVIGNAHLISKLKWGLLFEKLDHYDLLASAFEFCSSQTSKKPFYSIVYEANLFFSKEFILT
jgi:hypothetical protein